MDGLRLLSLQLNNGHYYAIYDRRGFVKDDFEALPEGLADRLCARPKVTLDWGWELPAVTLAQRPTGAHAGHGSDLRRFGLARALAVPGKPKPGLINASLRVRDTGSDDACAGRAVSRSGMSPLGFIRGCSHTL